MPYNRKSLKNLRPKWKPGQSGNPNGRPIGSGFPSWDRMRREAQDGPDPEWESWYRAQLERIEALRRAVAPPIVRCKACLHPDRALIDGLLILDVPMRQIEKAYGVTRSTLSRHWRDHLPEVPETTDTARDVALIEKDMMAAAQVIRMMINPFRSTKWQRIRFPRDRSDDNKIATAIWKLLNGLWEIFPFADGPEGYMQAAIIGAIRMLERVQGREFEFDQGTDGDLEQAQRELEEWGRTGEGQETGAETANNG